MCGFIQHVTLGASVEILLLLARWTKGWVCFLNTPFLGGCHLHWLLPRKHTHAPPVCWKFPVVQRSLSL